MFGTVGSAFSGRANSGSVGPSQKRPHSAQGRLQKSGNKTFSPLEVKGPFTPLHVAAIERVSSVTPNNFQTYSMPELGQVIKDNALLILIIEDTPLLYKPMIRALQKELELALPNKAINSGENGNFYLCKSVDDVREVQENVSLKDRIAFIVLDNNIEPCGPGEPGANFGMKNVTAVYDHFECPILFNSTDYEKRHRANSTGGLDESDWSRLTPSQLGAISDFAYKKGDIVELVQDNLATLIGYVNSKTLEESKMSEQKESAYYPLSG